MLSLANVPGTDKFRAYNEDGSVAAEGKLMLDFIPDSPGSHIVGVRFVTDPGDPANASERERLIEEAARA